MFSGKSLLLFSAGVLLSASNDAGATDQVAIQRAIDRGVNYLRRLQRGDGTWSHSERAGATALAGLTLLECGILPDDPLIARAAEAVRPATVDLTHTYSISTCILFLDRLGDRADRPLIESMAVRLLAGQNAQGGWTYTCPPISPEDSRRLYNLIRKRKDRSNRPGALDPDKLSREIQAQLRLIDPLRSTNRFSDNSNTKFATLALWVARRHGIPVENALALVETRFRRTQNGDGGWGYLPTPRDHPELAESFASMTCSGLLGLAAGHGAASAADRRERAQDPTQDTNIRAGLALLGSTVGQPLLNPARSVVKLFGSTQGDEYYFLWAIERVGVAYGLKTIGNQDWYAWGADFLLHQQRPDGGWHGKYAGGGIDTCFALLFLKQANLSRDLTAILVSGGVGGKELTDRKPQPADEAPTKSTEPAPENPAPKKNPSAAKPAPEPAAESPVASEAARLSAELLKTPADRQPALLDQMTTRPGVAYTQALAQAIPELTGPVKSKARDALAERLARMTTATLRGRLHDDDREIRRAAALACAMKEEKDQVPELIRLLEDPDPLVARASQAALQALTGQDFGPKPGSDRAKAVAAWKEWWERQQKKKE
jgi:hypothetical protein